MLQYNSHMVSLRKQSRSLLSSKNASITNPRLIVLGMLLKQRRPLTIDQLLKFSKRKLAQSTLYRVINDLSALDLVTEFTTPENTLVVEMKGIGINHHHHIFCEKCGSITDIELTQKLEMDIDEGVKKIENDYSISIRDHSLELLGTCATCQED